MSTKDQVIATAVASKDVPFAVAMAGNSKGITYSGAAGEAAPGRKAAPDTVFRIFSMTKAVGTTAAMILVDRGKLDVDAAVEDLLPEFAKIQVIDRFDGDKPVMRAPKRKATVRHLATHTSGLAYEFWNGDVGKYMAATGHPSILAGTKAAMFYPMVCDPGTRWEYGIGIDWLGQIVEKVDGRRVDRFLQDEIFGPLDMTDTACEVLDHMKDRLAAVSIRGEDGQFGPFEIAPPPQPEVYGMGHTLYSTAPDYMKFLRMFLNKGALDGKRVLSEKGVERMLTDHMNGLTFDKMTTVAPAITADVDLFPGTRKTHSFGFLRNEADIPGMRSAGSQSWAGVCNTHYWFDPKKDVAAVIMTQSLPFVEPPLMKTYEAYERAVYAG